MIPDLEYLEKCLEIERAAPNLAPQNIKKIDKIYKKSTKTAEDRELLREIILEIKVIRMKKTMEKYRKIYLTIEEAEEIWRTSSG